MEHPRTADVLFLDAVNFQEFAVSDRSRGATREIFGSDRFCRGAPDFRENGAYKMLHHRNVFAK